LTVAAAAFLRIMAIKEVAVTLAEISSSTVFDLSSHYGPSSLHR
jgi:hypothetical protein